MVSGFVIDWSYLKVIDVKHTGLWFEFILNLFKFILLFNISKYALDTRKKWLRQKKKMCACYIYAKWVNLIVIFYN